jgi:phage terminase small subunit
MSIGCTEKQRLFVEYYIQTNGNGTKSAMQAFACKTRKSASSLSYRLLQKPVMWAEMARIAQEKGDDVVVEYALEILQGFEGPVSSKRIENYILTILKRLKEATMAKCDRCGKDMEILICDECVEKAVNENANEEVAGRERK